MYQVPPDPPPARRVPRSAEIATVLVLGVLVLALSYGELVALIVGAPLAALWYAGRDALDRDTSATWAQARPRTILDPSTWIIILLILGLLVVFGGMRH